MCFHCERASQRVRANACKALWHAKCAKLFILFHSEQLFKKLVRDEFVILWAGLLLKYQIDDGEQARNNNKQKEKLLASENAIVPKCSELVAQCTRCTILDWSNARNDSVALDEVVQSIKTAFLAYRRCILKCKVSLHLKTQYGKRFFWWMRCVDRKREEKL